jgi:hypothetical protein
LAGSACGSGSLRPPGYGSTAHRTCRGTSVHYAGATWSSQKVRVLM